MRMQRQQNSLQMRTQSPFPEKHIRPFLYICKLIRIIGCAVLMNRNCLLVLYEMKNTFYDFLWHAGAIKKFCENIAKVDISGWSYGRKA